MSLISPAKGWFNKKVAKDEKMWMVIALILCVMLFAWMILWHVYGKQNPSNITYRTSTAEFSKLANSYVKKHMIGVDNGIPVVKPESNSDIFLLAEMWRWSPVLILKKDESYNFHISSKDLLHGFSLQPSNMNFQVYPGYDYVLRFKPTEVGEYKVLCNEFCGIGHHTMIGKIIVIDSEADLKTYGYERFASAQISKENSSTTSNTVEGSVNEVELAKLGEKVYTIKGCGACHKTDGTSLLAPSWKGLFGKEEKVIENGKETLVKVDEAFIKESIKEPGKKITVGFEKTAMPIFPVDDEEIDQLIAFIKTLK